MDTDLPVCVFCHKTDEEFADVFGPMDTVGFQPGYGAHPGCAADDARDRED